MNLFFPVITELKLVKLILSEDLPMLIVSLSCQHEPPSRFPKQQRVHVNRQGAVKLHFGPGHSFKVQHVPVIEKLHAIVTSHYNEAFVRNYTGSLVLSAGRNSTSLLTNLELAIRETLKFIFANWQPGVLLCWPRSSPEVNAAFQVEY